MTEADQTRPVLKVVPEWEGETTLAPVNNLPAQLTPLVGRKREAAAVRATLTRPEVRLLTLTGPGGVGKSRLGLRVAEDVAGHFPEGLCLVSLAPIRDPERVVPTIAQTLGLREVDERPLHEYLKDYLRDKRLLLLLDNFEHVAEAAPAVAEVLASCPQVKALVTSRAVLHLSGEHEFPVAPLERPKSQNLPDPEGLARYGAVKLFVDRVREIKPDFRLTEANAAAVAEICARLDGLPLAIELAAARIKLLPPEAMISRLRNRLPLLNAGRLDLPARQRTLRNTIEWSHDLLETGEQRLFRRLAVFSGGCTLHAAEEVGNAADDPPMEVLEALGGLLDKSMLRQEEGADGELHFTMLETIREYAQERLGESGEEETYRRAYSAYYLDLAEEAEPKLTTEYRGAWLRRLEAEHDNLQAVFLRSLGQGEVETQLRFGGALWWWIWLQKGSLGEGRRRLECMLGMLERTDPSPPTAARAKVLCGAGWMALVQGDYAVAHSRLEESVVVARETGDEMTLAFSLSFLSVLMAYGDESGSATSPGEESVELFRETDKRWGLALCLNNLGIVKDANADSAAAVALFEESAAMFRELGDGWGLCLPLKHLGAVASRQGDYGRAEELYRETLVQCRDLDDMWLISVCLEDLAEVASSQSQYTRAARLFGAAEALREEIGTAKYALRRDDYDRAVESARVGLGEQTFTGEWAEGRKMMLTGAVEHALARPEASGTQKPASPSAYPAGLTTREVEVLRLVADGLTDAQVADRLYVSPRTIGQHLRSVYRKLEVSSRTAAAREAVNLGLS